MAYAHWWEVTKYKYFVTVLKSIFHIYLLYLRISFPDDFLLLLDTFEHKFLYFLLLTSSKLACYLSSGGWRNARLYARRTSLSLTCVPAASGDVYLLLRLP